MKIKAKAGSFNTRPLRFHWVKFPGDTPPENQPVLVLWDDEESRKMHISLAFFAHGKWFHMHDFEERDTAEDEIGKFDGDPVASLVIGPSSYGEFTLPILAWDMI